MYICIMKSKNRNLKVPFSLSVKGTELDEFALACGSIGNARKEIYKFMKRKINRAKTKEQWERM